MSEEGAAPSISQANAAARAQLVNRVQRLWQSDPGSYWREFRVSDLDAKDVWLNQAFDYPELESHKKAASKK